MSDETSPLSTWHFQPARILYWYLLQRPEDYRFVHPRHGLCTPRPTIGRPESRRLSTSPSWVSALVSDGPLGKLPPSASIRFRMTCLPLEMGPFAALKRALADIASKPDLKPAVRDLRIDRDTQGIAGQPPIVETIFKKIDGAAGFVPDLTFVGPRAKDRYSINNGSLRRYNAPVLQRAIRARTNRRHAQQKGAAHEGHAHHRHRLGHRLTLVLHRQAAPGSRAAAVPGAQAR